MPPQRRRRIARPPSNRLRALRRAAGLTQAELGARCRPSLQKAAISKLETGKTNLTHALMEILAPALGVPRPADLLMEPSLMMPDDPADQIRTLWPRLQPAERVDLARELAIEPVSVVGTIIATGNARITINYSPSQNRPAGYAARPEKPPP